MKSLSSPFRLRSATQFLPSDPLKNKREKRMPSASNRATDTPPAISTDSQTSQPQKRERLTFYEWLKEPI